MTVRTLALSSAALALAAQPARAAEDDGKALAISVPKATKARFSNIVEVSGTILGRDDTRNRRCGATGSGSRPPR